MSFPISESTETQMISKTDDGHVTSFRYQSKSTHIHSQTSLPRFKTKVSNFLDYCPCFIKDILSVLVSLLHIWSYELHTKQSIRFQ